MHFFFGFFFHNFLLSHCITFFIQVLFISQTIALISVREGAIQLGSFEKVLFILVSI